MLTISGVKSAPDEIKDMFLLWRKSSAQNFSLSLLSAYAFLLCEAAKTAYQIKYKIAGKLLSIFLETGPDLLTKKLPARQRAVYHCLSLDKNLLSQGEKSKSEECMKRYIQFPSSLTGNLLGKILFYKNKQKMSVQDGLIKIIHKKITHHTKKH